MPLMVEINNKSEIKHFSLVKHLAGWLLEHICVWESVIRHKYASEELRNSFELIYLPSLRPELHKVADFHVPAIKISKTQVDSIAAASVARD